jgi:hypothetical protein
MRYGLWRCVRAAAAALQRSSSGEQEEHLRLKETAPLHRHSAVHATAIGAASHWCPCDSREQRDGRQLGARTQGSGGMRWGWQYNRLVVLHADVIRRQPVFIPLPRHLQTDLHVPDPSRVCKLVVMQTHVHVHTIV